MEAIPAPAADLPAILDRQAYLRMRKAASHQLYFPTLERKHDLLALAKERGYEHHFNQFLLQLIAEATSGQVFPPGYVDGLQKEVDKLRDWLQQKDAQLHELHQERASLLRQVADLRLNAQALIQGVRA